MPYSDEHGYVAVDRDAPYLLRFRAIVGIVIAALLLVAAIPSARDWAWRTFLPDNYARAHMKVSVPSDAALKAEVDKLATQMRHCKDGSVSLTGDCGVVGEAPKADKPKNR